jgi:hypothetical protein
VVDIFAGAATGLALLVVGEWLYYRWESKKGAENGLS